MERLISVILAAGEGKRMKSKNSKVTHRICGKTIIDWVYKAVSESGIDDMVVIVGHRSDQVKEVLGSRVNYAEQKKQLGTGHAAMQAIDYLKGREGYVLVLYGDTPLVTSKTLSEAVSYHKSNNFAATVITAEVKEPYGYGRIVRKGNGDIEKIVEHRDASEQEKSINEINSGMYCFTINHLVKALEELTNNNSQGEYYLTDTIQILAGKDLRVGAFKIADSAEIAGINDRIQLAEAVKILNRRILNRHMESGVTILDPDSTFIDEEVSIGMDTIIYPGTILEGKTSIGEDCIIGPSSRLVSAVIGNGVEISNSIILESSIGDNTKVGPFAYVRPGSNIGSKVKIGDFVEIKNSVIGDKSKVPHLAYVGDAELGRNVNYGCGSITANYDGKDKHKTVIGDNTSVGSNVNLVAPVVVQKDAYIAAGSTITEEVPENSLAIARSKQVIKENWVKDKGMERKEKE
jgi:bifunctional UDP-N-acetylglucosamine pyrophosphorylase/glucosamine-1-phosphate N-acetyltransferase